MKYGKNRLHGFTGDEILRRCVSVCHNLVQCFIKFIETDKEVSVGLEDKISMTVKSLYDMSRDMTKPTK